MGRLKPGATAGPGRRQPRGRLSGHAKAGLDSYSSAHRRTCALSSNQNRTAVPRFYAESGSRGIYDVNATELVAARILTGIVALVLLIVCANVANLLLSRATARQKDISVLAVDGRHKTTARFGQLLVESLLLAAIGGALGIAVGYWGKHCSVDDGPGGAARLARPRVRHADHRDHRHPFRHRAGIRATGGDVSGVLKETSRERRRRRSSMLSKALLVVQVAISLVLLIGAGLFLRTLRQSAAASTSASTREPGVLPRQPALNRYDETRIRAPLPARCGADCDDRRCSRRHAVEPGAALGQREPVELLRSGSHVRSGSARQHQPPHCRAELLRSDGDAAVVGREFTDGENNATAPKVAIINDAAAYKYFRTEPHRTTGRTRTWKRAARSRLWRPARCQVQQRARRRRRLLCTCRTADAMGPPRCGADGGDPLASVNGMREVVRQIDPGMPVTDVSTQMEQVERRFPAGKDVAQAYTLFGSLSLICRAVGLFGVMSYAVARRTSEIGIRIALGAQRGRCWARRCGNRWSWWRAGW